MPVYPRVCGGTYCANQARSASVGLSPRVRGNPQRASVRGVTVGSIPACAGEPKIFGLRRFTTWVYPRVCGGTCEPFLKVYLCTGLSPRVRGNLAGCKLTALAYPVYPRVCGGTASVLCRACAKWGSIPACAGEPRPSPTHPCCTSGLSPRVRGNPASAVPQSPLPWGSIPACAGEPMMLGREVVMYGVYPRVCGGTVTTAATGNREKGLSPRVRGNQRPRCCRRCYARSIPACAGEPRPPSMWVDARRVYPRVCGGTIA